MKNLIFGLATSMLIAGPCLAVDTLEQRYNVNEVEEQYHRNLELLEKAKDGFNSRVEEIVERLDSLPTFPNDISKSGFSRMVTEAKEDVLVLAETELEFIQKKIERYRDKEVFDYKFQESRDALESYEAFASECTGKCLDEIGAVKLKYQKIYDNRYFENIGKGKDYRLNNTLGDISKSVQRILSIKVYALGGLFEVTPMRRGVVDYSQAVETYKISEPYSQNILKLQDLLYLSYDHEAMDRLAAVLPQRIDFDLNWTFCDCMSGLSWLDDDGVIQVEVNYAHTKSNDHYDQINILRHLVERVELFVDRPEQSSIPNAVLQRKMFFPVGELIPQPVK